MSQKDEQAFADQEHEQRSLGDFARSPRLARLEMPVSENVRKQSFTVCPKKRMLAAQIQV